MDASYDGGSPMSTSVLYPLVLLGVLLEACSGKSPGNRESLAWLKRGEDEYDDDDARDIAVDGVLYFACDG